MPPTGITGASTSTIALPANYRPPSILGEAVPSSTNIYNGAPNLPMYKSELPVAKTNGQYKQCSGAQNATSCICASFVDSQWASQSDCLINVPAVNYIKTFYPSLILSDEKGTEPFNQTYTLIELNGRSDFYFSKPVVNSNGNYTIDGSANVGINWDGGELYHFRINTLSEGYCQLTTEFTVIAINLGLCH